MDGPAHQRTAESGEVEMNEQEKGKLLQGLQICSNDAGIPNQCEVFRCPYHDGTLWCRHELAKDAWKLIYELQETQEPIKPHIEHNLAGQPMWCCGNCGTTLFFKFHRQTDDEDERSQYRFCNYCGRKVKWVV